MATAWGVVALFTAGVFTDAVASDPPTIGLIEKVRLQPGGLIVHAKVDTGADTSSLNAADLEVRKSGGKSVVRFTVTSREGKSQTFERRVRRFSRIKRHGAESVRRPVIVLGMCIGKLYREVEVNLAKRSRFKYQMLIGRNFLAGHALVDASKSYTTDPDCPKRAWK